MAIRAVTAPKLAMIPIAASPESTEQMISVSVTPDMVLTPVPLQLSCSKIFFTRLMCVSPPSGLQHYTAIEAPDAVGRKSAAGIR